MLKQNERIDDLELNNLKIIQNTDSFCFGIDSVLLSDFAKDIKQNSKVVDLGTGTGIISILLCGKTKLSKIIGIEIQEDMCDMVKRSIELNDLQNRFEILNADIKQLSTTLKNESFDVVVMNPPYKKINTGLINENENKLISRHETKAKLSDFIAASSKLLKNNGQLYMVHRPDRLVDIMYELRKAKLEPKTIKMVYPKQNSIPNLVLIKAVKNGRPFLKFEKPLIVYNEDNTYTQNILKIYNKI